MKNKTKQKKGRRRTSFAFRELVPFLTSLFVSLGQHARKKPSRLWVPPPFSLEKRKKKKGKELRVESREKEEETRTKSRGTHRRRPPCLGKRRWRSMPMRNKNEEQK
jgi:hypothetical protein